MASRTTQKILVNEFMALTGVNEKVATKVSCGLNYQGEQLLIFGHIVTQSCELEA